MTEPVAKPETSQSAIALSLSVYFIWGALTLYWKELHGFDPFELIGWRITSSVVVLTVVMLGTRRLVPLLRSLRNPQLLLRIALASVLLTINWATYVWAVVNDHVIETALGYFIAPILTIVVGVFVLHEKLRGIQRVAVTFAVGGIAVLTVAYGRVPWIALIIATSWTFYAYLKKKVPLAPLESNVEQRWQCSEHCQFGGMDLRCIHRCDYCSATTDVCQCFSAHAAHHSWTNAIHRAHDEFFDRLADVQRGTHVVKSCRILPDLGVSCACVGRFVQDTAAATNRFKPSITASSRSLSLMT